MKIMYVKVTQGKYPPANTDQDHDRHSNLDTHEDESTDSNTSEEAGESTNDTVC
jgi:hypothetical protein